MSKRHFDIFMYSLQTRQPVDKVLTPQKVNVIVSVKETL